MVNQPTGGIVDGASLPWSPPHVDAAGTYTVTTELQAHLPTVIYTYRDYAPPTAKEITLVIGAVGPPDATRVVCTGRGQELATFITDAHATYFDAEVAWNSTNGGANTQWNMCIWYW